MISSIGSSLSSAGALASGNAYAKLAELNKHVSTLKQQLSQVQKTKAAEWDAVQSNSISQEIVNVQAQIERLALQAQLSKLAPESQANNDTTGKGVAGQMVVRHRGDAKDPNAPSSSSKGSPYQPPENLSGLNLDVQA